MQVIILLIIIIILFFYLIQVILSNNNEHFCYGNDFCNGNKDSALCINQRCLPCGLQAPCKNDSECGPNNCIDGCCDNV
jgi:hypothetical protein